MLLMKYLYNIQEFLQKHMYVYIFVYMFAKFYSCYTGAQYLFYNTALLKYVVFQKILKLSL